MYATSWLCMVIEITCYITNLLFLYLFQKHEELWYLLAPDIQTCGQQQINFIHPHWPFSISKHFIRLALLPNHFIISKHFLIIFFLTSSNFIVVYAFCHFEHFSFLFFETINVVNEHVWIDFFPKKKYDSTLICMKNLRIKAWLFFLLVFILSIVLVLQMY